MPMPDLVSDCDPEPPAASFTKRVSHDQPARAKKNTKRARRVSETAGIVMPPEDAPYVLVTQRESRTTRPTEKVRLKYVWSGCTLRRCSQLL